MRKSFFSLFGLLSFASSAAASVGGWCAGMVTSARQSAYDLIPFKLASPPEVRADLLLGRMPEQPPVTGQHTVVKTDQRPHLLAFLLPQNKFAF